MGAAGAQDGLPHQLAGQAAGGARPHALGAAGRASGRGNRSAEDFAKAGKVAVTFVVQPLTYQPSSVPPDSMSMDHMNMDHGDAGGHMSMKMMKMAPSGHGN